MKDWEPESTWEERNRGSTYLPGTALDRLVAVEVCGWQQVVNQPAPSGEKHKGKHRPRKLKTEAIATTIPDEKWLHPNGRCWPQPCAYSQHFQSALALLEQFAPTEFMVAYGRDRNGTCWARIRRRNGAFDTGFIAGANLAHALSLAALEAVRRDKAPEANR